MNARFLKNIQNKGKVTLVSFQNFNYVSNYLHLKSFCMETRLSNIFKTTNVTNLTKVIQEISYRVLQVTFKQKHLKQPVYFLKAVEFCPTLDFQIDITLAIFRENIEYSYLETPQAHRSLSKQANIHINWVTHNEITAL